MSPKRREPAPPRTLREAAQARVASQAPADLESLTRQQVRELVHEFEVHKVELQIQNEQLIESRLAAEASSERYRELYESAPIGFVTLDPQGRIVESNLPFAAQLGIPRSRLIGRKLASFVAPGSQDRWHLERRALGLNPGRRTFELEFSRHDATALHAQVVGARSEVEHALGDALRLAVLDVTELRRAERALRAAATQVSLVEQRERRKLASALHDGPGQLLSLALLKLKRVSDAAPAQRAALREVESIVTQASEGVSSLSFELGPPLLQDLGLSAAAQWLVEDLHSRYGLTVELDEFEELALDEPTNASLYRAMRELLINVAKHAGVRTARASLRRDDGMARVIVEDAGVGLGSGAEGRGYGLLGLRERFHELGGNLELTASPGGGTRAVASLPLSSALPGHPTEPAPAKRPSPPSRARSRARPKPS